MGKARRKQNRFQLRKKLVGGKKIVSLGIQETGNCAGSGKESTGASGIEQKKIRSG
jgi:hypothetical protein